ncbi:MAG: hypothetical protein GW906_00010 [Epsilonproteobacteria bacterium]|nr:hypothetical protein [Campylobacterota bacterium]OIO16956.1 MAG: hypothetical protein AUJ81_03090 [Helicobacteraceae bacterium CG1_02_36_14]PIP11547.1 MAG: hypothetical protein COX50_00050 [Sulfurimonas sp. CG23_combo_of_CG06-09_8_20_14_all_36_33]PIS24496.1 MAG: hypothetical protein COT46_09095 [Sulfurimonas sp. CG08_land_8_20_14_0_20_36_33]PIU35431.1 MAG: hypothetical protein COT05_03475 [Sulfurimonas sp. CG07_land_8_20_14_0_80_36_56]PIV05138.1 MAG: hypothetical protein COS56_02570 [Sulfur
MYENNTKKENDEKRNNEQNYYGKTRTKSLKSELTLEQFKSRISAVDMDITKFSAYFGISRPTIYGWNTHGIPVYVERIIELLETKKQLHKGIDDLYEINTDKINKLHQINTNEPTKSKKVYYMR